MKFRNLMLALTLTVSIIFVTVIGATYAYYNISSGSVNITTGDFNGAFGIVFNNSDYIDLNTGIPISSSEVETKASKVTFTLVPDVQLAEDYDLSVKIGLSNIDIDDDLKVSDLKYRLNCNSKVNYNDSTPASTGTAQIFNGTAASFNGSSYTIATLSTDGIGNNAFSIDDASNVASQMYECTLYMWLEDSGTSQNALMGKHFGANVEVTSTMKKR